MWGMNGVDTQDIHMSRLAGWIVNTFGKALLLSMLVAFVGGLIAGAAGNSLWITLAAVASMATFGLVLYISSPPLPRD